MSLYNIDSVDVDGVNVFYRYAGNETAPVILLLHGFPSSSAMFRHLMPLLAMTYFVIAPDFPGFGFTQVPAEKNYTYSFANLTETVEGFVDALHLDRFSMYIFDYGAPVGLRLALNRPQAVSAIFSQNGNAYIEGLGGAWNQTKQYWATGSEADRDALRSFLTLNATKDQYLLGSPHPNKIQPETYYLDQALLDREGLKEIQLDLIYDYRTNVDLYPKFQEYFRSSGVPVLAVWGKNDQFFIPPGAEAFARDVKNFELHYLEAGHFALETNEVEMAGYIDGFIKKNHIY